MYSLFVPSKIEAVEAPWATNAKRNDANIKRAFILSNNWKLWFLGQQRAYLYEK